MPEKKLSRLRIFLISIPFIIAALVLACVRLAIYYPETVERYYSNGMYPFIAAMFSAISSVVPFSLYDMSWLLTIILALSGVVLVIFRTIRFRWFLLRMLQAIVLVYSAFYLL